MTRIPDLLAAGTTVSLEFSPPRDAEAAAALETVMDELETVRPSFASMTYGALGSTRDATRDVVLDWNAKRPFPTMAHLTCVGHSKAEIAELLDAYAAGGVENILALGGDPPADGTDPGGDFRYAAELVETVRSHPAGFAVGVAAHPEKHPRSASLSSDRQHLADKLALADFAVTQFVWTADPYVQMVNELADLGVTKPVIPGVMLFINVHAMRRMSSFNDTVIPEAVDAGADAVDGDPKAVRLHATDVCEALSRDLLAAGAPGLHLYTMNRAPASIDLVGRLGLR
mgnify:CR=1 FL=1